MACLGAMTRGTIVAKQVSYSFQAKLKPVSLELSGAKAKVDEAAWSFEVSSASSLLAVTCFSLL